MLSRSMAMALAFVLAASCLHGAGEQWQLVLQEDFDSPKCLGEWSLDGPADVSVTPDGKLRIKTEQCEVAGHRARCSVLWHRAPFWGDLRIEFDAKAARKSRCLFLFNARATGPDHSIFAWKRPLAAYADYAYEPRIELYSMGILRSDQKLLNLRHLGGRDVTDEWINCMPYHPMRFPERWLGRDKLVECMKQSGVDGLPSEPKKLRQLLRKPAFKEALAAHVKRYREIWQNFQDVSIVASHEAETPVFGDPERFYHVAVTVRGPKINLKVDGATIIEFLDTAREKAPLAGGYLGFRNFVPTEAQYDSLRVYRRAP